MKLLNFFLLLCVNVVSTANASEGFWIVTAINGSAADCKIVDEQKSVEQQESQKLALFTPIFNGNKLDINKGSKTSITLHKPDNTSLIITADDTPYLIKIAQANNSVSNRLLDWVKNLTAASSLETVTANARGDSTINTDSPALLGFNDGINFIRADTRTLLLNWRGGKPPFTVKITDEQNNVIGKQQNIKLNHIRLNIKPLTAKQHFIVSVSNADLSRIDSYQITAVTEQQWPAELKALQGQSKSEEAEYNFKIFQLAALPASEWLFQAWQFTRAKN